MAECNTCGGYLSIEDKIRLSMKCDANGNVVWQGALLNPFKDLQDQLIADLTTAGIFQKADLLYNFIQIESEYKKNLVSENFSVNPVNSFFQQGKGLGGNYFDSYTDSGFNLLSDSANYKQNDACIFIYTLDRYDENLGYIAGATTSGNAIQNVLANLKKGLPYAGINGAFGYLGTAVENNMSVSANRLPSDTKIRIYANGAQCNSTTVPTVGLANLKLFIGALNFNGALKNLTSSGQRIAFVYVGAGLNATEQAALFNIVDSYMVASGAKASSPEVTTNGLTYKWAEFQTQTEYTTLHRGSNINLGFNYDKIYYTKNGVTNSLAFAFDELIENGFAFQNGSSIICMRDNTIYRSTDQMLTQNAILMKDIDNTNYVYASGNGYYFKNNYAPIAHGMVNDKELAVWGNYSQPTGATNPINVYYSVDGVGLKIALKLEDTVTHVHSQKYNPADSSFWIFTGDSGAKNCWYKGVYDTVNDTWTWEQIISNYNQLNYERFRLIGIEFFGEFVVWGSDGAELGIYKCKLTDINDISKHRIVHPASQAVYSSNKNGNTMYVSYKAGNIISYSKDQGETWFDSEVKIASPNSTLSRILDVDEFGFNVVKNYNHEIKIKAI